VVSFNGATRLILGCEFFTLRLYPSSSSISIYFRTFPFTHSSLTRIQSKLVFRSPLVLTSAITCPLFPDQAAWLTGARQLVPSRSIAQQRTNSLLPTATMAIFLRDFLPPLRR
jgi:hypothetical protein